MEANECVVCGASLWYTSGDLCALHEQWRVSWRCNVAMMRLHLAVQEGRRTDFLIPGDNYADYQTSRRPRLPALSADWRIYVDDMLRWAWYVLVIERLPWLQDDNDGDGQEAA